MGSSLEPGIENPKLQEGKGSQMGRGQVFTLWGISHSLPPPVWQSQLSHAIL